MHVHTTPERFLSRLDGSFYATPAELRGIYDQIGVEKALLLPSAQELSMREARNTVRDNPDTLGWWFCNFSTRIFNNDPELDLSHIIKSYMEKGAKGIGEVTENIYFDDPFMLNLFKHAELCGMPLTFHIGNMGRDYGIVDDLGLPRLERVLAMFPKLIFLGHSQKFWAEIGNDCTEENRVGYPEGPVKPGRIVELMRKYKNLCGDLSAGSGCNALTRDPEFAYGFLEEFQDRLFYGTDICDPRNITNPMLKLSGFLDEAMLNGRISYAAYEKISRGNALNLLER